jgi:hypothetical protein
MNDLRKYVNEGNVKVLDMFVIHNKYRSDKCGCKITIPTKDIDVLLNDKFWPEGISCRMWEDRRRDRRTANRQWQRRNDNESYDTNEYDYDYESGRYDDYEYEREY